MRCPKCRTLVLFSAGEAGDGGSLVRCPRCPAVWLTRCDEGPARGAPEAAPITRRGPLIIEGELAAAAAASPRFAFRRYGFAAGAAAILFALAAVVLLAPDVSALPVIALIEGGR